MRPSLWKRSQDNILQIILCKNACFYTDYFNGSNSPSAVKANQKYEKAKAAFKKVWDSKNGAPAFNDYSGAMLDVVNGNVG